MYFFVQHFAGFTEADSVFASLSRSFQAVQLCAPKYDAAGQQVASADVDEGLDLYFEVYVPPAVVEQSEEERNAFFSAASEALRSIFFSVSADEDTTEDKDKDTGCWTGFWFWPARERSAESEEVEDY